MEKRELENYLKDYNFKLRVQHEQFFDWLRKTFWFSNELQKSYNRFYQELFIVHIYQLITEGKEYIGKVLLVKKELSTDYDKYKEIETCIIRIESTLSDSEIDYIEHARHCTCHIFQNKYEKELKKNDTIKTTRKGREIDEIKYNIKEVQYNHYDKGGFNKYFNNKIAPILTELYIKLNN